jgi:hypothetical protein
MAHHVRKHVKNPTSRIPTSFDTGGVLTKNIGPIRHFAAIAGSKKRSETIVIDAVGSQQVRPK